MIHISSISSVLVTFQGRAGCHRSVGDAQWIDSMALDAANGTAAISESTWKYGKSMESMEHLWLIYGKSMENLWKMWKYLWLIYMVNVEIYVFFFFPVNLWWLMRLING